MKKYYWLCYAYTNAGGGKTNTEEVTMLHPFEYMRNKRMDVPGGHSILQNITLLNWKEITKKEYEIWLKSWR